MSATNMNLNSPKLTTLLMILVLLFTLILCKRCAAQVPVDKDVLNYLFKQNAKAFYLEKDVKLCDSINVYQKSIISEKDSLISNRNEAIGIHKYENDVCNIELNTSKLSNKKLSKKVTFFKFTTISAIILGSISTLYFLIH